MTTQHEDPAMTEGRTRWTPPGSNREAEQCPDCGAVKWADEPCTQLHYGGEQPPVSQGYDPAGRLWTPPRKRRHVFRWVFLAVQAIFLAWVIGGAASSGGTPKSCTGMTGQALTSCQDAGHLGTTVGVALIVFFWLAVDVILGLGWLIFRKRS